MNESATSLRLLHQICAQKIRTGNSQCNVIAGRPVNSIHQLLPIRRALPIFWTEDEIGFERRQRAVKFDFRNIGDSATAETLPEGRSRSEVQRHLAANRGLPIHQASQSRRDSLPAPCVVKPGPSRYNQPSARFYVFSNGCDLLV